MEYMQEPDMRSFGYKIMKKNLAEEAPVVLAAIAQQRPLEVGLYSGDQDIWEFVCAALDEAPSPIPVNTHFNHYHSTLFELGRQETQLREQFAMAKAIGSDYSVTHIHKWPVSQRPAFRDALEKHLVKQLQLLERFCAEYDHPVHIENTFHPLAFYRWFFGIVERLELRYVHVCFDIGHAKVWSPESLPEWMQWLHEREENGLRLHFHLHANNGLTDQHLTFVESEQLGLNAADAYTQEGDYFAAIAQLHQQFPTSRKMFEVKPALAVANMELVMARVASPNQ
jgi:sugar phosphate isomerase/epimerase